MTHRTVLQYLVDFASGGDLRVDLARQIKFHVSGCQDCRDWLDTYRALEAAMAQRQSNEVGHPSAETLARFAIVPEFTTKEITDSVSSHLEQCFDCAEEVELCQHAVGSWNVTRIQGIAPHGEHAAFGVEQDETSKRGSSSIAEQSLQDSSASRSRVVGFLRRPSVWMPLAASAVVALAVSVATYWTLREHPASETYFLTQQTLTGVTTIEAREKIEATSSLINPSAVVTLRAKTVVLGDGFTVGNGASFTIESTPR